MAIQSTYVSETIGFTADTAYTKINNFYVDRDVISIFTKTYYNGVARFSSKQEIGVNTYTMPYVDGFTFAQMYQYLKEQSEFINAIDVL